MSSEANTLTATARSSAFMETGTMTATLRDQLRLLLSIWDSLDRSEELRFLRQPENAQAAPIVDSLPWMSGWTATKDDQDQTKPYRPFPRRPYFELLHELLEREPILFIEKSRTMMCSWWAAGETRHDTWIRQPSKTVFWAQDEDRAVMLVDMCWTLIEHDKILHRYYPLDRPRNRQAYNRIEWKDGSEIVGLPGKDPEKIRGEHPTRIVMDECYFIERWAEAFDVALATRVPKILCISSAAPSEFREFTRNAVPVALDG